jgi:hypothetical protein
LPVQNRSNVQTGFLTQFDKMLILLGKNGAQGRSRTTDTAIFRHVFNQFHQALSQTTNGKPVQETVQLENRGPGTVLSITAESASLAHDGPEPPRSGCPTDSRSASSARVRRYARPHALDATSDGRRRRAVVRSCRIDKERKA